MQQWIELGYWVIGFGSLPVLAVVFYFLLARQWVRYRGRSGTATLITATPVAHLPHLITEVTLDVCPSGEPAYVKLRLRARWSEHLISPSVLLPGTCLRVRYRLARTPIVMPDGRAS